MHLKVAGASSSLPSTVSCATREQDAPATLSEHLDPFPEINIRATRRLPHRKATQEAEGRRKAPSLNGAKLTTLLGDLSSEVRWRFRRQHSLTQRHSRRVANVRLTPEKIRLVRALAT